MRLNLSSIVVLVGFALQTPVFADVINPNYHPVERCAAICNLDAFPDIVLIAAVYAPDGFLVDKYVVKKDSCLSMGYKFNRLNILWTTLEYFNQVGLAGLDIPQCLAKKSASTGAVPPPVVVLTTSINPYGATVPDSDPLVREELQYRLFYLNNSLIVYLAKKTSINSDKTSLVESFEAPATAVAPRQSQSVAGPNAASLVVNGGFAILTSSQNGPVTASFYDCAGRSVVSFSRNCIKGVTYIHGLAGLAPGLYWVRLATPAGSVSKQLPLVR
jgi:hypothetical protein